MKAGNDGMPGKYTTEEIGLSLFDMEKDPYETTNVLDKYPQVAERLKQYAQWHKQKFYANNKK